MADKQGPVFRTGPGFSGGGAVGIREISKFEEPTP